MRLTEEERTAAITALRQKVRWCCTVCGELSAERALIDMVELSLDGTSCILAVLVVCTNCAHMQMFSWDMLCRNEGSSETPAL